MIELEYLAKFLKNYYQAYEHAISLVIAYKYP